MMIRSLRALLPALLLSLTPGVHAQSAANLDLARELVVRSGLAEQLKGYPVQVDREMAQARGRMPDEVLAALREAARVSYDPAQMQQDIVRSLAADMAPQDMREAIAWLDTAPGRRVTLAEEAAATTVTPEAVQAYAAASRTAPPLQRRSALIGELIAATRAVDHTARFTESISLGVAVGVDATRPEQNRIGLAQLRERLRVAMPPEKLREVLGAGMPLIFGVTYRDVSDADLAAYLEFNRSPLGVRYNDAMMKAFTEAVTRASIGMGPLIQKAMGRKAT